jgi:hypothetical protein
MASMGPNTVGEDRVAGFAHGDLFEHRFEFGQIHSPDF